MIDYFERKLNWLRENYNKDEFIRIYAIALKEKDNQDQETMRQIAELFSDFVAEKKLETGKFNFKDVAVEEKVKDDYQLQHIKNNFQNAENLVNKPKFSGSKKEDIVHKDGDDERQLQWGGGRSSSRLFDHPMRTSPMFFRRNGMVMDIINMYQNSSVFVINNGPSFKHVDKDKLKLPGIVTYGINNGGHAFRPNIWSCVDDPARFLGSVWKDPSILKIIPQSHFEKSIWDRENERRVDEKVGDYPNVVGFRRNEYFKADRWMYEDTINWGNHKHYGGGRSVLMAVIRICHLLGFKNIYLLGCDFNMDEENRYWFDEQRTNSAIKNNNNSYEKMIGYFTELKPYFDREGLNIYNLNPDSNLKVFPFMDFDDAIKRETIDTSESTYGMYVKRD